MKVILSRKGFDSSYGGVPSPIFADGLIQSLPIGDKACGVPYRDITRGGINLGDLVQSLTKGRTKPGHLAHLDPDLNPSDRPRNPGWRGLFGQANAALTHLVNQGVGRGDIFLFFGWFRAVEKRGDDWRYVRTSPPVQLIWGWMSVDDCMPCQDLSSDVRAWALGHPHLHPGREKPGSLFIAASRCEAGGRTVPGAGFFGKRTPARILTDLETDSPSPSCWRLPRWMHPSDGATRLSYHDDPGRWRILPDGCQLKSAPIGQEFVLATQDHQGLTSWLAQLFHDVPALEPQ